MPRRFFICRKGRKWNR